MSIVSEVGTRLRADATVRTLFGNPARIYPGRIPGNVSWTFPIASYFLVIDSAPGSLDGDTSGLRGGTVQVDCYSDTYAAADDAASAVEAVLRSVNEPGFKARRLRRRDQWDKDAGPQGAHCIQVDFSIWMDDEA